MELLPAPPTRVPCVSPRLIPAAPPQAHPVQLGPYASFLGTHTRLLISLLLCQALCHVCGWDSRKSMGFFKALLSHLSLANYN